jgi:small conductance mechanosensitive channel
MDTTAVWTTTAIATLTHVGLMVLGAIVLLIVGRWLIGFAVKLITHSLEKQRVDPTLLRYVGNIVSVVLNVALIVAILGFFGVETIGSGRRCYRISLERPAGEFCGGSVSDCFATV